MVGAKRWDHMRLGFAVQLGTVRFLGAFLDDPADVPAGVAADLARQLGIADPAGCLARYGDGRARWQHAREIRQALWLPRVWRPGRPLPPRPLALRPVLDRQ